MIESSLPPLKQLDWEALLSMSASDFIFNVDSWIVTNDLSKMNSSLSKYLRFNIFDDQKLGLSEEDIEKRMGSYDCYLLSCTFQTLGHMIASLNDK
jgi:hypothetical protein